VKITTKPRLDLVKKRFALARKKLKDTAKPHKEIALMLDGWVQRNFKSEGGKVGGWTPLTLGGRWKGNKFDSSAKILQDSSRLRLSFTPFSDKRGAGIGSFLDYSEVHEEGMGVAKRRMLPISIEVRKDIYKLYSRWMTKQTKQAKL